MTAPYRFTALASYTSQEAELANWANQSLPGLEDWRGWLAAMFGSLLETPAGFEVELIQTHCLEPGQPPKRFTVEKPELILGRSTDCDIVLPAPSVGKRHARLTFQEDECQLEDLGSTLGTFVDQHKVRAGETHRILPGESLTIFPYKLELRAQRHWKPETNVRLSFPGVRTTTWGKFRSETPEGFASCVLSFHPDLGSAHFELSEALLDGIVTRAIERAGIDGSDRAPMDWGIAEFLFLSLLESASAKLAFPLQVAPDFRRPEPDFAAGDKGLVLSCTLELTSLRGGIRLFMPYSLLRSVRQIAAAQGPALRLPPTITWWFPVSAGFVELTAEELGRLEPGDILIFSSGHEILFPGNPDRGWKASLAGNAPWVVRVAQPFERSLSMDSSEAAASPLGRLPLRLHVVLGEKEFALSELSNLAPGTLIQLDRGKADPVRLAVNGRVVGEGELVEIDGKLGVKVLSWNGA